MNVTEAFYMGLVAKVGCVVCTRLGNGHVRAQVHHVAVGTAKRSDFAIAALCMEHHDPGRSGSGFHGMGTERFCKIFRVPGEREEGLLVWTAEDVARYLRGRHPELAVP